MLTKTSTSALLTMSKPLIMWITTNCGKFLKRWEYQTTLPASWEICTHVKKQQLEPDVEQRTGSKLGKEYVCISSSGLFNFYAEYIMQNARLDEAQAAIKIARRNINNLRDVDDTILVSESKEELCFLDESERGEWKSSLKLNIQNSAFIKLRSWHLVPSLHGK